MSPLLAAYGFLLLAIVFEVAGTTFLQLSQQFTRLVPTLAMAGLYLCSFYFLSQALRTMPLGLAYALWGGLGIVLTSVISVVLFRQSLDAPALVGIGMIVGGVFVVNVFSRSITH